mgnify:CR=1 FL=1
MAVFIETREGLRGIWSDKEVTKIGKAFAEIQRISECFVKAGLQAQASQLWITHWTPCWRSDPYVKEVWMREEQVNKESNWSETQVTLECPRWNASARRVHRQCPASAPPVPRQCPPRAGCRPESHFYPWMQLPQPFITWTNHVEFICVILIGTILILTIMTYPRGKKYSLDFTFATCGGRLISQI